MSVRSLTLRPAVGTDLGRLERNAAGRALVGVVEVDQYARESVVAAGVEFPLAASVEAAPEKAFEKIAEFRGVGVGESAAVKFESLIPVGRRAEILTGLPVGAELVVGRALLRILQHLVGLTDLLEALLGIRLLADVGMELARKLAVRTLNLVLRCVTLYADDVIVIFKLHLAPPRPRHSAGVLIVSTSTPYNMVMNGSRYK